MPNGCALVQRTYITQRPAAGSTGRERPSPPTNQRRTWITAAAANQPGRRASTTACTARGHPELREDMTQVVAHGVPTDEQGVGDLPVAHALRQQRGDLQFPGGRVGGLRRPCAGDWRLATQVLHRMDQIRGAAVAGLLWPARNRSTTALSAAGTRARWSGSVISAPPERPSASAASWRRTPMIAAPDGPGQTTVPPLPHDGSGSTTLPAWRRSVGEDRFRIDNDGSQGRGAQADSSAG